MGSHADPCIDIPFARVSAQIFRSQHLWTHATQARFDAGVLRADGSDLVTNSDKLMNSQQNLEIQIFSKGPDVR